MCTGVTGRATPAEDALGELLPAAHRLNDVHAGTLTDGGARLQLATGPVVVPPHMRKVLRREGTASILCNGPDDGRASLGTPSLVVRSGHRRCARGCCARPGRPIVRWVSENPERTRSSRAERRGAVAGAGFRLGAATAGANRRRRRRR
jgi:hypothetical protein